jgi:hypothetical protein
MTAGMKLAAYCVVLLLIDLGLSLIWFSGGVWYRLLVGGLVLAWAIGVVSKLDRLRP